MMPSPAARTRIFATSIQPTIFSLVTYARIVRSSRLSVEGIPF